MAISEKDFRQLSSEVSSLKATVDLWNKIVAGVASVGVVVGLAAVGWCFHISSKVDVLESGGDTKLVTELRAPSSDQQLRANLVSVTAQIERLRVSGVHPNPRKLATVSTAVGDVIQKDPAIPEGWQAASALVSLRSANLAQTAIPEPLASEAGPPQPNLGNCYERPMTWSEPQTLPPQTAFISDTWNFHDCTLYIDDISGFENSVQMNHMRALTQGVRANVIINLNLVRVKIAYRGGPLIPVSNIRLYGCTFDFDVFRTPPRPGARLFAAVLNAPVNQGNILIQLLSDKEQSSSS